MTISNRYGRHAASLLVLVAIVLAAALTFSATAFAQPDTFLLGDGHEGAYTAPAGTNTLNYVAPVNAAVAAGSTSLTIGTIRNGTATAAATQFEANRLVLIHQSTNFTGTAASGDQTPLDIATDSVGSWELARVSSVAGSTLNLTAPLVYGYAATGAQVVAVPEFTTMTVAGGRTLNSPVWNGSSGGIIAFLADDVVNISGTVTAAARGFRGGANLDTTQVGCTELDGGDNNRKGEGLLPAFYGTSGTNPRGYGNKSHGAGGGNCADSGGGGGGHGGLGGKGGFTIPSDGARDVGGRGGSGLTYSLYDHMTFGGGGGSGDGDANGNTNGAIGGGIVWGRGASLSGAGTFSSTGANAVDSSSNSEGAGGGGAGGAIYLRFTGTVACTSATVAGGDGGSLPGNGTAGPGAGGAGGKIVLQGSSVACTATNGNGLAGGAGTNGNRGATPTVANDPAYSGTTTNPGSGLIVPVSAVTVPSAGLLTNDNTPTISGTSTANATIAVYIDGVSNGTTTADGSGNWTYAPGASLSDGAHSVYVYPTYLGITGAQSNTRNFTIDTAAPAAPNITTPPGALTTNDNTPTISGTAEANSTVTIYDGVTSIGTTTTDGAGSWTFTPGAALSDGVHTVTARA
ncbi:MAG: Ig-like domain-containing protein, partial [Solirubrobacterales bacterium]